MILTPTATIAIIKNRGRKPTMLLLGRVLSRFQMRACMDNFHNWHTVTYITTFASSLAKFQQKAFLTVVNAAFKVRGKYENECFSDIQVNTLGI
jgi:hypothetical protein